MVVIDKDDFIKRITPKIDGVSVSHILHIVNETFDDIDDESKRILRENHYKFVPSLYDNMTKTHLECELIMIVADIVNYTDDRKSPFTPDYWQLCEIRDYIKKKL